MSCWPIKLLGEICSIKTGKKDVNNGNPDGKYPFFTCARAHTYSDSYSFDTSAILIAGNGDVGHVKRFSGKFEAYQRTYVLDEFNDVSIDFIYYILDGELRASLEGQKLGNTMPYIKVGMLKSFSVPIPPLAEQQRIVAILDEAFEGIAAATAHAGRNLQNARELFQSVLHSTFSQKGDDWECVSLGDLIRLKSGDGLTAKKMVKSGAFNVYGGNGVNGRHDKFNLEGEQVVIGRVGALCGNVHYVKETFWLTDNAFRVDKMTRSFHMPFLAHLLRSSNLRSTARQSAQPVISNNSIREVEVIFPVDVETQKAIVQKLDALSAETRRLESIYTRKLAALAELKQSLLQRAFVGEL